MHLRPICSLFLLLLGVISLISCGDSDSKATISKPTTTTTSSTAEEATTIEINVAAEETAIRALHKAHDDTVNQREAAPVMEYWSEGTGMVMAHNFFGIVVISRGRQKVRATWHSIFARKNRWLMKTTIETVVIEKKRGKLARSEGRFNYLVNAKDYRALYEKGKDGEWKIKAIDYGNNGLIQGFKVKG